MDYGIFGLRHYWFVAADGKVCNVRRKFLAGVLIFCMVFFSVGCGKKRVAPDEMGGTGKEEATEDVDHLQADMSDVPEGLLRVAWGRKIESTDIHVASNYNYIVSMNIYDTLFVIETDADGNNTTVPSVATGYEVSPDGCTYVFTLRDDVRFSDGTYLTADDVVFTLERMLQLQGNDPMDFKDEIQGAKGNEEEGPGTISGVRVIDDTHLEIALSAPYYGLVNQLATPVCSILNREFVEKVGDLYGTSPEYTLGSGAYVLDEMGTVCKLSLNPYYWGEKPSVTAVEVLQLEPARMTGKFLDGDIDMLVLSQSSSNYNKEFFKDKWKSRLVEIEPSSVRYLVMNASYKPLDDVRVRKAIQLAINREKLLNEVFDNEGRLVDGIFPRKLMGFCEENQGWLTYNPDEAKRLLQEAGVGNETRLELAVSIYKDSRFRNMIAMIASDLRAVGLNVRIVNYDDAGIIYLRKNNKLMLYGARWEADYDDPSCFIYSFFGSPNNTRFYSISYKDEAVMNRVRGANAIVDADERMKEYAALERKIIQEDAALVPLFTTNARFLLGDRVESFVPFWAGWDSMYFDDVVLK